MDSLRRQRLLARAKDAAVGVVLKLNEVGWIEHSFHGHTFSLPGNYIKVVDHAFQDYKFLEFIPSGQENITFQDEKLLQHLCHRFPRLQFDFLDGRLYVESKPRWVHDYAFALQLQLHYFEHRHGGQSSNRKWTFLGPSCVFRKSGIMTAMNSDVTIVPTMELMKCLNEVEGRGGEVPHDVEGMICLEVALVQQDVDSVHEKCRKMVRVMGVKFVVGIFPDMGIVRTYTHDHVREHRIQSLYVDMGEAIPGFRFYLRPLPLGRCKPACFCSRDWIGMMNKEDVVTAVCSLIKGDENDCAKEGVFCALESVNIQDKLGRTPMVVAAAAGNWEMLRFLLAEGGKVDYRDQQGMTPLLAAMGVPGSEEWLESNGLSMTRPSVDDIRLVVQGGADHRSRLKTVFGMANKGVLEKCMVQFVRELWLEGVAALHEIGNVALPRRCIRHVIACDEEAIPLLEYVVSRGVTVDTADVMCAADDKVRDFLASKLDAQTGSTS